MLMIRDEQMQVFRNGMELGFRRQLVAEMRIFAPWHFQALGIDGMMHCAHFAMLRAGKYGFTNRGLVRLYLQMVFLLGAEFDSDPLLPWAAGILSATSTDQNNRASELYEKLTDYLKHVAGPNHEYTKNAAERANQEFARGFGREHGNQLEGIAETMSRIYPEKYLYAGEAAVHALVQEAGAAVARWFGAGGTGALLFSHFMFALGHGVEDDPHLPWIREALKTPNVTPGDFLHAMVSRLGSGYLERMLGLSD